MSSRDARLNWERRKLRRALKHSLSNIGQAEQRNVSKGDRGYVQEGSAAEDRFVDVLTECENAVEGPVLTEMRP